MTNVFTFIAQPKRERLFSFCKRPEAAVSALISSNINGHCICSDCIRHAKTRIDECVVMAESVGENAS